MATVRFIKAPGRLSVSASSNEMQKRFAGLSTDLKIQPFRQAITKRFGWCVDRFEPISTHCFSSQIVVLWTLFSDCAFTVEVQRS